MNVARQIWAITARHNILFNISHIIGRDNIVADILSRAHLSTDYYNKLQALIERYKPIIVDVNKEHLLLQDYTIITPKH